MAVAIPRVSVVGGRLAREVYAQVKQDLLAGRYQPGAALAVTDLRELYQVSKQPVMEAMRALSADRLIEIQPQVGVRVMSYPPEEVNAFFDLFSRTEGAMAYRAAICRSDAQLAELGALCAALESSMDGPEAAAEYISGNRSVHRLIHRMADSELAAQISADLWDLSDFLVVTHGHGFSGKLAERNQGHRDVLEAIGAGDARAAERAMIGHILDSPLAQRQQAE